MMFIPSFGSSNKGMHARSLEHSYD